MKTSILKAFRAKYKAVIGLNGEDFILDKVSTRIEKIVPPESPRQGYMLSEPRLSIIPQIRVFILDNAKEMNLDPVLIQKMIYNRMCVKLESNNGITYV